MLDRTSGIFDLTPIEKQMLVLLAEGCTTKDIMICLRISKPYVYHVVGRLMDRFNVRTRSGVVAYAIAKGLIVPSRALQKQVQFVAD